MSVITQMDNVNMANKERIYRKSGNFHVEIIHVVNIQC